MTNQTVYIKFINPRDVELLDPVYFVNRTVETRCPKCGGSLYLPVKIGAEVTINQPMGQIFRPFPKEMPNYITRDEPERVTLGFIWLKSGLTWEAKQALEYRYHGGGLQMIDQKTGYIELAIEGFSEEPVDCKTCNPQSELDPCKEERCLTKAA